MDGLTSISRHLTVPTRPPQLFEVLFIVYWLFVMVFLYSSGDVAEVGSKSSVFEPLVQPSDIVEKLGLPADYNSGIPDTKFFSQYAPEAQQYETACADSPDCAYEVSWDRDLQYAALYHIFGLFWTNEFILGMGYMVLAMVFAQFYFYRGERERLPKSPVWESFKTVGRKHLGSVALGSFIVAVIKMIRFLVEQTEKQLKQKMGMDPNGAMKIIFAIMKYCLWLIEKIMKVTAEPSAASLSSRRP